MSAPREGGRPKEDMSGQGGGVSPIRTVSFHAICHILYIHYSRLFFAQMKLSDDKIPYFFQNQDNTQYPICNVVLFYNHFNREDHLNHVFYARHYYSRHIADVSARTGGGSAERGHVRTGGVSPIWTVSFHAFWHILYILSSRLFFAQMKLSDDKIPYFLSKPR